MMCRNLFFSFAMLLSGVLGYASSAQSTVVVMHSLEEMTRRSELVVEARVADQRVVEEEGRIITLTDIEVIDGLKGAKPGDVLTIYQVGGTLNGTRMWIEGAHRYEIGEQMIFFGVRHGARVVSYGVGLGKFRVIYDGSFHQVVEDLSGVVVMKANAQGETEFQTPTPRSFPSLASFKSEVQQWTSGERHLQRMPAKQILQPRRLRDEKAPGSAR